MQDVESARRLAESMVAVGNGAGMKTSALLTDMSVPLAWSAGNALEVREAVDYFRNPASRHPRLNEVVLRLGTQLLIQSGRCATADDARQMLTEVRDNGTALEIWARQIEAMGGDPKVTESPEQVLNAAPVIRAVRAPRQVWNFIELDQKEVASDVLRRLDWLSFESMESRTLSLWYHSAMWILKHASPDVCQANIEQAAAVTQYHGLKRRIHELVTNHVS